MDAIVDTSATSLYISLLSIAFNPIAWNIVARNGKVPSKSIHCTKHETRAEYKHKTITRLFGGNARYGCYFLAVLIFSFGLLRDHLYVPLPPRMLISHDHSYQRALADQPRVPLLPEPYATVLPIVLFALGQLFVLTSTYALGITGTFLGDYFGILMDHRVEGFPFNVLRDPMYVGSTLCFSATALW